MNYAEISQFPSSDFKRLWGVLPQTFQRMVEIVRTAQSAKKLPGRPCELSVEDQLLMTLQYWREYRTYFHTWEIYVSGRCSRESNAYRTIRQVENALIKSGVHNLERQDLVALTLEASAMAKLPLAGTDFVMGQ
jgi:Helix-turn-helix of DDE superfamily endonuclease